jgi:hypothetical protein
VRNKTTIAALFAAVVLIWGIGPAASTPAEKK